jgi:mono/diheme cytochrome c family protein
LPPPSPPAYHFSKLTVRPPREARMRRFGSIGSLLLAAALATGSATPGAPRPAQAKPSAPPVDSGIYGISGAYTYRTYCASCHGTDGRGDGPLAENLRFHPPDLTLVAKRHGGEYPTEHVHRVVDGRKPLPGHGGPDMPVWGDAFRNAETGYDDAKVEQKIRSVVDYVRTLQAK